MQERGSHDSLDLISVSGHILIVSLPMQGCSCRGVRSQHLRKGGSKMECPQNTREDVMEIGESMHNIW